MAKSSKLIADLLLTLEIELREARKKWRALNSQRKEIQSKRDSLEERFEKELGTILQVLTNHSEGSPCQRFRKVTEIMAHIDARIVEEINALVEELVPLNGQISDIEKGIKNIEGTIEFVKSQKQIPNIQPRQSKKGGQSLQRKGGNQRKLTYREVIERVLEECKEGTAVQVVALATGKGLIPPDKGSRLCIVAADLSRKKGSCVGRKGERGSYVYYLKQLAKDSKSRLHVQDVQAGQEKKRRGECLTSREVIELVLGEISQGTTAEIIAKAVKEELILEAQKKHLGVAIADLSLQKNSPVGRKGGKKPFTYFLRRQPPEGTSSDGQSEKQVEQKPNYPEIVISILRDTREATLSEIVTVALRKGLISEREIDKFRDTVARLSRKDNSGVERKGSEKSYTYFLTT